MKGGLNHCLSSGASRLVADDSRQLRPGCNRVRTQATSFLSQGMLIIVASKSSKYNLSSVNIRGILFYDIVGVSTCLLLTIIINCNELPLLLRCVS